MLSILIASRDRVSRLTKLLNSIRDTCNDPTRIETLVIIDNNDPATCALTKTRLDVKWVIAEQQANISRYYNTLARIAKGTHLFILNDDCVLVPQRWLEAILALPDGHYGRTLPTGGPGDRAYSEFPVLTRGGIDALGFALPEEYPGWGADHVLWRIYEGAGRVVDLPVTVRHERDSTSFNRMACISGRYDAMADVSKWVEKLKR